MANVDLISLAKVIIVSLARVIIVSLAKVSIVTLAKVSIISFVKVSVISFAKVCNWVEGVVSSTLDFVSSNLWGRFLCRLQLNFIRISLNHS